MDPKAIVGRNVRKQRTLMGLSQEALAERAGMYAVEISRAERGLRDLRLSTIVKLAEGLEVPASDLLRDV